VFLDRQRWRLEVDADADTHLRMGARDSRPQAGAEKGRPPAEKILDVGTGEATTVLEKSGGP